MIGCVCLNSAVDVTYEVDALVPSASHRVRTVRARAGGKGINVARVLRRLGERPVVLGFAGGATGTEVVRDLDACGLPHRLGPTDAATRRTVAVVAPGDTTVFNEPGGPITEHEWGAFLRDFDELCRDLTAVALSGSLPVGVPRTAYSEMGEIAHRHDVPVLLDADGDALRAGSKCAPELITPNDKEIGAMLGVEVDTEARAADACRTLVARGVGSVVITRGSDGLVALRGPDAYSVAANVPVRGNPTGAGDSLAAVLVRWLARGEGEWTDALRQAVAVAAATVVRPVAGEYDPEVAARLLPDIVVNRL